ncbi:MAG: NAD-dependent deacylase [Candidatus Eremiobacteraeota bacterium]|nr:NAD-dependent deacylase [Candidatus Eremiobacteraeota bacterium]
MPPLQLDCYQSIVILTGAGVSAGSQLPTYRGADGLWKRPETADLATVETLNQDPQSVWRLFGPLRSMARQAQPNAAHLALARLQQRHPGVTLITQNVDGLHQRAGSPEVVELHGNLAQTRCSDPDCKLEPFQDQAEHLEAVPTCQLCGGVLRPDIVLFGEALPARAEWLSKRAFRDVDLFMAIGTSGTVDPAARFVEWAAYAGAWTINVNLEPGGKFDQSFQGKAEELVPELLDG